MPAADRRAVASAANWLRAAGVLGGLHLFCCACFSFAVIDNVRSKEGIVLLEDAAIYLLECVTSLTVYKAAKSLERRSSLGLVRAAGVLSLITGALALFIAVALFFALSETLRMGDGHLVGPLVAAFLFTAPLVVTFLVGGFKALDALSRPAVYSSFER